MKTIESNSIIPYFNQKYEKTEKVPIPLLVMDAFDDPARLQSLLDSNPAANLALVVTDIASVSGQYHVTIRATGPGIDESQVFIQKGVLPAPGCGYPDSVLGLRTLHWLRRRLFRACRQNRKRHTRTMIHSKHFYSDMSAAMANVVEGKLFLHRSVTTDLLDKNQFTLRQTYYIVLGKMVFILKSGRWQHTNDKLMDLYVECIEIGVFDKDKTPSEIEDVNYTFKDLIEILKPV